MHATLTLARNAYSLALHIGRTARPVALYAVTLAVLAGVVLALHCARPFSARARAVIVDGQRCTPLDVLFPRLDRLHAALFGADD